MNTFRTSVRIKDAQTSDYERLDNEMAKQLFARVPVAGKSAVPNNTSERQYDYRGSTSLQDVTAAAYKAARKVGKEYSFTVIRQKRLS
jgi:hypothetical protein